MSKKELSNAEIIPDAGKVHIGKYEILFSQFFLQQW